MSFFKKLKNRLFKSSSKLEEGLDAIVEDGGEAEEIEVDAGPSEAEIAAQEAEAKAQAEAEAEAQAKAQARAEEDARQAREAEERRAAEAAAAAAQEARLEQEARQKEEARLAEEARQAEQARRLEEERRVEEERLAKEAAEKAAQEAEAARQAKEAEARAAQEARAAEEAAKAAEEERQRLAQQAREAADAQAAQEAQIAAEAARLAAEQAAEEARAAEDAERRAAEEARLKEDAQQQAAQAARLAEEAERRAAEEARLAEEDRAKAAEVAAEEAARIAREEEERRATQAAAEAARLEDERLEAERVAEQDAARLEAERLVTERLEAEAEAQAEQAAQEPLRPATNDDAVADAAAALNAEPERVEEAKPGFFGRLIGRKEKKTVIRRELDDDMLEALEELLIASDMGVDTALRVTANMAEGRFGKKLSTAEIKTLLADEITAIMEPVAKPMPLYPTKPQVVLVVGVNGSGKTTTIGKLASQFQAAGKKVVIAAGDTFRAAAVEQLQVWGDRAGVPVLTAPEGSDPASLAFDAMTQAQADGADLLMIDTAGRLQNRADLMEELAKIVRVIRKKDETAPHNTLLVLDATTGQNALNQVDVFQQISDVSGLVMTKLDGTAKGGVLVALADKFGLPIHAIGVGEQLDDLAPFDPEDFAQALTGADG